MIITKSPVDPVLSFRVTVGARRRFISRRVAHQTRSDGRVLT